MYHPFILSSLSNTKLNADEQCLRYQKIVAENPSFVNLYIERSQPYYFNITQLPCAKCSYYSPQLKYNF